MKSGQHIWKCQSNTCAEMGMAAEQHPEHLRSLHTANTFYVPTVDRPKQCVKYFSDHHRGMYVDTYPKRGYLEKMAMYLDDAFELVKNQISIPIPGFLENIRQKIRNVLSRGTIPWRRYAIDSREKNLPESEEEIEGTTSPIRQVSVYDQETEESDADY
ncbi:unnamed protein product [Trichogramma brassicae]|uniref:Uncharacterized protein n=1 Tax=Trichogramma brassicae TaxID=86971 RepID=A0A6H5J4Q3_9HYME|nr:unnamed protein product [Trichogramma brassicae]